MDTSAGLPVSGMIAGRVGRRGLKRTRDGRRWDMRSQNKWPSEEMAVGETAIGTNAHVTNGRGINGRGRNGSGTNGFGTNGFGTNGFGTNGFGTNSFGKKIFKTRGRWDKR